MNLSTDLVARNTPARVRSRRIPILLFLVPVLAVLAVIAADHYWTDPVVPEPLAAEWQPAGYGPASYSAALDRVADQLDLGRERVRKGPGQWLRSESLARGYMARARLTGSFDDLAQARTILTAAVAAAPAGSGPLLSDAVLAMMTHRLDDAQRRIMTIERAPVQLDDGAAAEAIALAGDVKFYRGNAAAALDLYRQAAAVEGGPGVAYRLAILAKSKGEFDQAIAQFRASEPDPSKSTPFQHAATALQIGAIELARGDYGTARMWFQRADRQFPGYWLIQAHLAQARALDGDIPGAIAAMEGVATRSQVPEVMDALAMLLRAEGRGAESRAWADRAGVQWRRRIALLPEAAYGHALEHELMFGTPAHALDLARRNLAARPYGESRLMLASAYLMGGNTRDALAQLAEAERTGWRSAPLYALRAQALELAGNGEAAAAARKDAEKRNPRIFMPETALVWFSHG